MKKKIFELEVPIKKITELKVIKQDDKWIIYEGKDNSYITFFKTDFKEDEIYEFFNNSSKFDIDENLKEIFVSNIIKEIDIRKNKF